MRAGPLARARAALARASDARLALVVFAVAFAARLAFVLEIDGTEWGRVLVGDATAYDAWARAIAAGDWLGHEVFYQAPLYPYVLAVVYAIAGPSAFAVRLLQAALGGGSCVLLAAAGRRFFSRGVGLGAGLVLALYGPAIFFTGLVHKMTLDLFFTTFLLYALARLCDEASPRRRWLLLAGAGTGCLALTRENALAWLPVLLVWLAWRRRADGRAVARALGWFVGGALLVLGPVAARNAALGGVPLVTTSQAGVNFYLGNNADADGTYAPLRFGHGSFVQERQDAIELAEQARGRALSPAEVSSYWSERAWSWIGEHPGAWARLLARKWMLVWGAREIPDSDEPAVYRDASLVLRATWPLSFGVIAPLALVGVVASLRARRRGAVLVALLLTSAAGTAAFLVFGRYRVPMIPIVVLYAAVGASELARLARERPPRVREAAVAFTLLVVAAIAGRFPRVEDAHPRAIAYYNLGVTLEGSGETARAADAYRAALGDNPDFEEAHVNLGALLTNGGDLDGGAREEREALRLKPDDATAHTDLANALLQSGRLDEAEVHYRAALRVDPDFASARDGLEILRGLRERPAAP
ncbi:MAG TPA: tetratricopeptide repeat protein [Polyangia bacterium]|nr:tetratricopeptide repeat protein [Polyangia bacterium]